jgi:hypothetical protein
MLLFLQQAALCRQQGADTAVCVASWWHDYDNLLDGC